MHRQDLLFAPRSTGGVIVPRPEQPPRTKAMRVVMAAGLGGIGIGVVGLAGWAMNVPILTTFMAGQPAIQPLTAVCILLCGACLLLHVMAGSGFSGLALTGAWAGAGIVVVAATWTLGSYLLGGTLPLDRLLFPEQVANQPDYAQPGRMAVGTAASVLCIAVALALAGVKGGAVLIPWLAVPALLPPALAGVGYILSVESLHRIGFSTPVALPAALALLALAVGTLALASQVRWVARLTASGPGAQGARGLLFFMVAVPVGLAWLADIGVRSGLYGTDVRLALMTVVTVVVLTAVVLWNAARVDNADAERAQAEEALRQSEDSLRRIVEDAPYPMMVHAEDGTVVHMSRAWLDLTGYDATEIATVNDWIARAHGDRAEDVRQWVERLYALERPLDEGDYEVRTADGRTLIWSFRSAPVRTDEQGRRLVVSIASDITERQESEARLRLLMREVDHRAKNALAVVQAIVQLSRADDPDAYAQAVQGRIAAMADAHSLLASSGWSGVSLRQLVEGRLRPFLEGQGIELSGPDVAIGAEAAQAIAMVLHELVTNAAKYGALSRPDGRLRVAWDTQAEDNILCMDWDEHTVAPITGPPVKNGFGTTLLHRTIQKQLAGRISMDWRPEGLRCHILLPADTWHVSGVIMERSETGDAAPLDVQSGGEKQTVLVVEDEALTAIALSDVLEAADLKVLGPIGRVPDALDLLRTKRPDAAILDINVFGVSVTPVAEQLKRMGVPFLFCTGYYDADVIEVHPEALVLHKPVGAYELLAALEEIMAAAAPAAGEQGARPQAP